MKRIFLSLKVEDLEKRKINLIKILHLVQIYNSLNKKIQIMIKKQ